MYLVLTIITNLKTNNYSLAKECRMINKNIRHIPGGFIECIYLVAYLFLDESITINISIANASIQVHQSLPNSKTYLHAYPSAPDLIYYISFGLDVCRSYCCLFILIC